MSKQLVAQGISVVILDNRASGQSKAVKPFTLKDMEDDVVAIWDHLMLPASSLLGISMGGFIAQGIAARHSERVRKLILISTASGQEWLKQAPGAWSPDSELTSQRLASYFSEDFVGRNKLLFDAMVRQTLHAIDQGEFIERSNMQRAALLSGQRDWSYDQIKAETLIIHGDHDQIVDVKAAYDLQNKIKKAQLEVLQGAGHLLLAENPKKIYELAANWVVVE